MSKYRSSSWLLWASPSNMCPNCVQKCKSCVSADCLAGSAYFRFLGKLLKWCSSYYRYTKQRYLKQILFGNGGLLCAQILLQKSHHCMATRQSYKACNFLRQSFVQVPIVSASLSWTFTVELNHTWTCSKVAPILPKAASTCIHICCPSAKEKRKRSYHMTALQGYRNIAQKLPIVSALHY